MLVNLNQYRAVVGAFNSRRHCRIFYINISIRRLDVLPTASAYLSVLPSFCFSILLGIDIKIMNILLLRIFHIYAQVQYVFHIWLHLILTKRNGDIEQNSGSNSNSSQRFFICHWNLNSFSVHNFIKISLVKSYIATHQLDVICFIRNRS